MLFIAVLTSSEMVSSTVSCLSPICCSPEVYLQISFMLVWFGELKAMTDLQLAPFGVGKCGLCFLE